jgi:DNA-binding CsgD family transcriptional regulator
LHDDLEKSSFSHFDQEKIEDFTQRIFTRKLRLTTLQKDFNVSARELECLKYKSQGMTAKEIAKKCDISHRTVETHLNKIRINSDLNIHQLINLCRKVGLF